MQWENDLVPTTDSDEMCDSDDELPGLVSESGSDDEVHASIPPLSWTLRPPAFSEKLASHGIVPRMLVMQILFADGIARCASGVELFAGSQAIYGGFRTQLDSNLFRCQHNQSARQY